MKLTKIGVDYIEIDESFDFSTKPNKKVHIIKLSYMNPTKNDVLHVFSEFPETRRYVISNNIRFYNNLFKYTRKKFYVENTPGIGLFSFFRRNNKCLLNVEYLSDDEKKLILDLYLNDILKNVEVIRISKYDFLPYKDIFYKWNGNVIVEK